jgi:Flp pilus assembly protein TadD
MKEDGWMEHAMLNAFAVPARQMAVILAAIAMAAACATTGLEAPQLGGDRVSEAMLLDRSPLLAGAELPPISDYDILAMSPEMEEFVDGYLEDELGPSARLQRLLFALMGEEHFELVYEEVTRTAQGTFRDQRGNCMSFTNMFVAMARYAGLDARYQEVDIPPLWSSSGQSALLNQHINVYVEVGSGRDRVVDFNIRDYSTKQEVRVISDERARAHYFNNIGAEEMLGGDTLRALANFRQSIREDAGFSPAWVNLGNLYRRDGYADYAEAAYLRALQTDSGNLVGMSNLANLYTQEGYEELAAEYLERVRYHRMQNPYYRYHLATLAFVGGDYEATIAHAKKAIRIRDDDPKFYSLVGVAYLMQGERDAARRWMGRAEGVAQEAKEKERYREKLDGLMGVRIQDLW